MKKINLSAYHPILSIEKHIVFANNGNVVLCYKAELPEIYSLSSTDFEDIHGSWLQAFKSLPTSTVIHKQDIYKKASMSPIICQTKAFWKKQPIDILREGSA